MQKQMSIPEAIKNFNQRIVELENAVVAMDIRATIDQSVIDYLLVTVRKLDPDIHAYLVEHLVLDADQLHNGAEATYSKVLEETRSREKAEKARDYQLAKERHLRGYIRSTVEESRPGFSVIDGGKNDPAP